MVYMSLEVMQFWQFPTLFLKGHLFVAKLLQKYGPTIWTRNMDPIWTPNKAPNMEPQYGPPIWTPYMDPQY
jgi:hypothetical protein